MVNGVSAIDVCREELRHDPSNDYGLLSCQNSFVPIVVLMKHIIVNNTVNFSSRCLFLNYCQVSSSSVPKQIGVTTIPKIV